MNILKQLTIQFVTGVSMLMLAPMSVLAQAAEDCPNPGPYDVCTPDTDIVLGGVRIDNITIVLMLMVMLIGFIFLANGLALRQKLHNRK